MYKLLRALSVVLALAVSSSLFAAPPKTVIGRNETVCCEAGQLFCGDIVPQQCNGKALKVYNRQGMLLRVIPARPTDEEQAANVARERQKRQAQVAALEQRRKDQALLETYSSIADIDRMQKYAEDALKTEISNILIKVSASQKKKRELDTEVEGYSAETVPLELAKALRVETDELRIQSALLSSKRSELDQVRQRYSQDRIRYIELTTAANQDAKNP